MAELWSNLFDKKLRLVLITFVNLHDIASSIMQLTWETLGCCSIFLPIYDILALLTFFSFCFVSVFIDLNSLHQGEHLCIALKSTANISKVFMSLLFNFVFCLSVGVQKLICQRREVNQVKHLVAYCWHIYQEVIDWVLNLDLYHKKC